MNSTLFNDTLKKKVETLKKIRDTNYPIVPNMAERHEERVRHASQYIDEIDSLVMASDKEIYIVHKSTFEKRLEAADFVSIESDGQFHQLALVSSFPATEYYMVWFAPLSEI